MFVRCQAAVDEEREFILSMAPLPTSPQSPLHPLLSFSIRFEPLT